MPKLVVENMDSHKVTKWLSNRNPELDCRQYGTTTTALIEIKRFGRIVKEKIVALIVYNIEKTRAIVIMEEEISDEVGTVYEEDQRPEAEMD